MSTSPQGDMGEFWSRWGEKFMERHSSLIVPDDPVVEEFAMSIPVGGTRNTESTVNQIWSFVVENITYELSKEWKKPRETIKEGIGDCEDLVFLVGSILPHFGFKRFKVKSGTVHGGGRAELHTWIELNGKTIDPTTTPDNMENLTYKDDIQFDVEVQ